VPARLRSEPSGSGGTPARSPAGPAVDGGGDCASRLRGVERGVLRAERACCSRVAMWNLQRTRAGVR
jgi:hypothetical protein